jgi:polyhydroxyalkanoate synthesis regulator phasin
MKKLFSWVLAALFITTTGIALAQDATTAPKLVHPRIHEVHKRMKMQLARIDAGVKSGKLTTEQAQALRSQLKAVQAQMDADYQANGNKVLTEDQKAQLNQMLDQNSKVIFQEKNPNAGSANVGNSSTGSTGANSMPPASN